MEIYNSELPLQTKETTELREKLWWKSSESERILSRGYVLKGETVTIDFDGGRLDITPDMVDVRIESKEGFNVGMQNNKFIILNTELTQELILEGIARELVRKIQSLRKDADLVITDRIKVYYDGDTLIDDTIKAHSEFIKNETLAVELIKKSNVSEKFDMNDTTAELKIEKI